MALTDELEKLVNNEIAIVMNDGMAYRGTLIKFDEETVVMEDVFEASQGHIDWIKSPNAHNSGSSTLKGYLYWRKITLPKLFARTDKILRIWPWLLPEEE